MSPIRLALVQLHVAPGEAKRNLDRALHFIRSAATNGAQIILLPEALPFGWTHPSATSEAGAIPDGTVCTALRRAARENSVFVCSGIVERDASGRLFNAAVLIDPIGTVLLHHRKIFELDIAHDIYALGDRLAVADTPMGRVGLMICADGFAPRQTISRALALMGADLILSPCAWAVPPEYDNSLIPYGQLWLDNYGPVARDFGLWIAGCSNVGPILSGPWAGHKCIGCSMVIDPSGAKVASGAYGPSAEETILLDIPLPHPRRRCRP